MFFTLHRRDLRGRRIAVGLKGRLGNQLFQLGLARSLSARGARVVVHPGTLEPHIDVAITPLLAAGELATDDLSSWKVVRQADFGYDPDRVSDVPDGALLDGHWTSAQYFDHVARPFRRSLMAWTERELTADGRTLLQRLRREPGACSLHVRRGDYVSNPNASRHHGNLDVDYYRAAMDRARELGATRFYAFSDDLAWVRDNLGPDIVAVPRNVGHADAAELRLMAQAQFRIVANSTFSWWGAWLGESGTTTIAPSEWFAGPERDLTTYVPSHWIRIPTFRHIGTD